MIVVTGATGKLGTHVVKKLVARVPGGGIVAAARNPEKAKQDGVVAREADYSKPATLERAFEGADKVLLISGNEMGKRLKQHTAAIEAAKKAGVKLLVYTSLLRAKTSRIALAEEHAQTEEALEGSGLPYVILRNCWYFENYTDQLGQALQMGAMYGAAGDGRLALASRADYAQAAVEVLLGSGYEGRTFELAGDYPVTMTELASEVSRQSGKTIEYRNLSQEDYKQALIEAGIPEAYAHYVADSDFAASVGELDDDTGDLHRLIGPTTTLSDAVAEALKR